MDYRGIALSWYTKGYIQKIITLFVFVCLSIILAYIIERLCYSYVLEGVDSAVAGYVPTNEIPDVKRRIYNETSNFGVKILWCVFGSAFVMYLAVKASTRFNFIRSVTLDKAVRFGEAMERLGLVSEPEQALFVRSHQLPLYIADHPLLSEEAENIQAKPYVFAHNILSSKEFVNAKVGQRQLCVKADELQSAIDTLYASLKLDNEPDDAETVKALQKKVMELEQEKRAVSRQLVDNSSEISELKAINKKLASESKGEEMREGKKKKSEQELALHAIIFAPVYRKLAENRHDPKDFTRAAMEDFFGRELSASPRLFEQWKQVTGKKVFNKLPANILDAIWNNLKDFGHVNAGGAAPSGSMERLTEQFYPNHRK